MELQIRSFGWELCYALVFLARASPEALHHQSINQQCSFTSPKHNSTIEDVDNSISPPLLHPLLPPGFRLHRHHRPLQHRQQHQIHHHSSRPSNSTPQPRRPPRLLQPQGRITIKPILSSSRRRHLHLNCTRLRTRQPLLLPPILRLKSPLHPIP